MIKWWRKWFKSKPVRTVFLTLLAPGGIIVTCVTTCKKADEPRPSANNSPSVSVASNSRSIVSVNQTVASPTISGNPNVVFMQSTGTVNYYATPDTMTKLAVEALEARLRTNSETIDLTRRDVRLLADALKDLDRRTVGIERLPDGRARLGDFIVGQQTFVTDELRVGCDLAGKGQIDGGFLHFSNAIYRWEKSQIPNVPQGEPLMPEAVASMYSAGATMAASTKHIPVANEWASKATQIHSTVENELRYITTLRLMGSNDLAQSRFATLEKREGTGVEATIKFLFNGASPLRVDTNTQITFGGFKSP